MSAVHRIALLIGFITSVSTGAIAQTTYQFKAVTPGETWSFIK